MSSALFLHFRRIRFGIPITTIAPILSGRNRKSFVRLKSQQLPSLGPENVTRLLPHRSWFHIGIKSNSIFVRNSEHLHSWRATPVFAICHRFTLFANGRFQIIQSTVDHCTQNARSQRKSRRLFAIGYDMCELLEIARVFKPWGHAKQIENGMRWGKHEFPFVLNFCSWDEKKTRLSCR